MLGRRRSIALGPIRSWRREMFTGLRRAIKVGSPHGPQACGRNHVGSGRQSRNPVLFQGQVHGTVVAGLLNGPYGWEGYSTDHRPGQQTPDRK